MKFTTVLTLIFVLLVVSSNCLRLKTERTSESGFRDSLKSGWNKVKKFGSKVGGHIVKAGRIAKEVYHEYNRLKKNGEK